MRGNFWGRWRSPMLTQIDGLSPAISIDQKTTSRNPRSTVGTVTEIHDYLRLLYARVGHPALPRSAARRSRQQTVDQMVDAIVAYPEGHEAAWCSRPVVRGRKGEHAKVFEERAQERLRARAGGRRAVSAGRTRPRWTKRRSTRSKSSLTALLSAPGQRAAASRLADSMRDWPDDALRRAWCIIDHDRQGRAALLP